MSDNGRSASPVTARVAGPPVVGGRSRRGDDRRDPRVADAFAEVARRPIPKVPTLRGKTVATLFFEESTRTRLSFETAAKRLLGGHDELHRRDLVDQEGRVAARHRRDARRDGRRRDGGPHRCVGRTAAGRLVRRRRGDQRRRRPARAPDPGAARLLHDAPAPARSPKVPVGGRGEASPGCGSASSATSATAGSPARTSAAFAALGAEVTLVAPGTLMPPSLEGWPVASVSHDLESVLAEDRRLLHAPPAGRTRIGSFLPSAREYTRLFGLTARRAALLPDDAVVMHPGPMNRGSRSPTRSPTCRVRSSAGR